MSAEATAGSPIVVSRTCAASMCKDKGTYSLRCGCYNCGAEHIGVYTKGHEFSGSSDECPNCDCRRLYRKRA